MMREGGRDSTDMVLGVATLRRHQYRISCTNVTCHVESLLDLRLAGPNA